jgi:PAS domain S-box-containing protein
VKDPFRVLLLEDDYNQAEMVHEFLQLDGPFDVDLAGDLHTLWKMLAAREYDILLLDYRLPDGTGLDVLAQLAQRGYNIPAIMVTGQGDERVAAKAIQCGALDYLVKGSDHLFNLPAMIRQTVRNHKMQLEIERSLEQIRYQALLLNNVRDAVVVWDMEGRITYWNPAAQGLFGWSPKERLGQDVETCYLEMFTPAVLVPPEHGTSGHEVERQCRGKDGRLTWVSSRVATLRDYGAGGRIVGYMDVVRDISERKEMQAQIQSAQTQLVQSARLAAIGELASGVAHYINNPLTTIIADSQLLLQELPTGHPGRESAEAIVDAGWRAQSVVQRLLEFSRPPSGAMGLVSVNSTIERALVLVGSHVRSPAVNLEVELADDLPLVRGDARQLEDLWVNLLLVARDATGDGGRHTIRLRSQPSGQSVLIEVRDDGVAIPPDQLASIFEPSFIGPTNGRGSGMELSICREIVRQHRGEISAQSSVQGGTAFRVDLPARPGTGRLD